MSGSDILTIIILTAPLAVIGVGTAFAFGGFECLKVSEHGGICHGIRWHRGSHHFGG